MNGSETMTIYLDEQNLPPLSSSTLAHSLESKGFLPAVEIRDFPIRDNKVTGLPIKSFATPLNLPPTERDIPKNSRLF